MKCKQCNSFLKETDKFCSSCGASVDNINEQISNNQSNYNGSVIQNNNENQYIEQFQTYNNVNTSQTLQSNFVNQESLNQQNITNGNDGKSKVSIVSLVLGIISLVLFSKFGIVTLIICIVGLILGIVDKVKSKIKIAGIIINSISIVLTIISFIISSMLLNINVNKVFNGDGFKLNYDYKWDVTTLSGKDVLSYNLKELYFLPIGKSALTDYSCDFDSTSCKVQIYNDFYNYWSSDLSENSLNLYRDSNSFFVLKDDIYYGTYNYGKSMSDLKGKYYLLVSKDKNVVLSFMINTTAENIDDISNIVLELLETIEIETYISDNSSSSSDDEELYEYINSMSNWNIYSDLRKENLGKVLDITGGFRILSDSEVYWEFKNGEFWWYKSLNNLNDNYWYGTTKVLTGKEGLKLAGVDETKVDYIVSNSNGKITADNIYTIVCTPTKVIIDGEDKTATNMTSDTMWTYVWILIDHGDEGIEAQVLNVDTTDMSYYVKIKD